MSLTSKYISGLLKEEDLSFCFPTSYDSKDWAINVNDCDAVYTITDFCLDQLRPLPRKQSLKEVVIIALSPALVGWVVQLCHYVDVSKSSTVFSSENWYARSTLGIAVPDIFLMQLRS